MTGHPASLAIAIGVLILFLVIGIALLSALDLSLRRKIARREAAAARAREFGRSTS